MKQISLLESFWKFLFILLGLAVDLVSCEISERRYEFIVDIYKCLFGNFVSNIPEWDAIEIPIFRVKFECGLRVYTYGLFNNLFYRSGGCKVVVG